MVKLISTTIGGDTVIKGTSYTVSAGVDKVRFRMLSGGTYAYDASGSVTTLVSDDKGEVLIYGLPDGNYGRSACRRHISPTRKGWAGT